MKKVFLIPAIVLLRIASFAQANFVITDAASVNVTNSTQVYWVDENLQDSRIYDVTNISSQTINVKVRRTILQLCTPTAVTSFCTGVNCYAPATNMSISFAVGPGASFTLTADYFPDSVAGVGLVRYAVLDQAVASDSVTLDIQYNKGPTGMSCITTQPMVLSVFPVPAVSSICLNLENNNGDYLLCIYSSSGSLVMQRKFSQAEKQVIDISTLDNGIYFASVEQEGKNCTSQRIIVQH